MEYDIDCIEIEEELRSILKGKNMRGYMMIFLPFIRQNTTILSVQTSRFLMEMNICGKLWNFRRMAVRSLQSSMQKQSAISIQTEGRL